MKTLAMSKKRHKKYTITELSIKKVRYIKFAEIDEKNSKVINALARQVLNIAKNENDSNEVAITYNMKPKGKDKKIVGVCLGTIDEVNPLKDTTSCHIIMSQKECAVVSLHNHPALSIISLVDLNFFLSYPSVKIMVVIANNGKISYLQKSNKFDSIKAIDELNKMKKEHKKHIDKKGWKKAALDLVKDYFKRCKQFGIIYKK